MNNDLHSATRSTAIRDLNDRFRRTLTGGTLMLSAGVIEMGAEAQARIIKAVQDFDAFDADNDPHGEHDFGGLDVDDMRVLFKLDCLDLTRTSHSPDPAGASATERVMTIMLAEEY